MIQKTALFGGTFDPVHNGHLELAEAAGNIYNISEVIFLPAAVPPHKQHQKISTFEHRLAMLEIAVKGKPLLQVSPLEERLPAPSYTIDTLHHIQLHSVAELELYFIIGADAFLDISSWRSYGEVLQLCDFIVFLRDGCQEQSLYRLLTFLGYCKADRMWRNPQSGKCVHIPNVNLPAVSSSLVRDTVRRGQPLRGLVPGDVARYISEEALYARCFPHLNHVNGIS